MPSGQRYKEIPKRRTRKAKIAKLRVRYATTKNEKDREKIEAKLHRLAPWLAPKEILKPSARTALALKAVAKRTGKK